MSLRVFKTGDFVLIGGVYVSPPVQIETTGAAVQIATAEAVTVTVQRAVNAKDYTTVPDFELAVNGLDEFNVANAVKGQWIRIASTIAPVSCNILI